MSKTATSSISAKYEKPPVLYFFSFIAGVIDTGD